MRNAECAACGATDNLQYHHLIPRSMGGSDDERNLITLCGECHAKAHGVRANWGHSELTRRGLEAAKARGVLLGNRTNPEQARAKGHETNRRHADTFAERLRPTIQPMLDAGLSYREIARRLNAMGIQTAREGTWAAAQVSGIARRLSAKDQEAA